MARRKSGRSSAGLGVMVVLGGIVWAVSAAYNFIAANPAAILAVLVLTGAVSLIVFGLSRIGKSKLVEPASGTEPVGLNVKITGPYL